MAISLKPQLTHTQAGTLISSQKQAKPKFFYHNVALARKAGKRGGKKQVI